MERLTHVLCLLAFLGPSNHLLAKSNDQMSVEQSTDSSIIKEPTFTLGLGLGQAKFVDGAWADVFAKVYDKPSRSLLFHFDWHPLNVGFFKLGTGFELQYMSVSGTAVPSDSEGQGAGQTTSSEEKLKFTMVPYTLSIKAQVAPYHNAFVNLEFLLGYQEVYVEEVRRNSGVSSDEQRSFVNTAWSSSQVMGLALNFKLDALDEESIISLKRWSSFHSVYVSPFYQVSKTIKSDQTSISRKASTGIDLATQVFGISFLFVGII